MKIVILSSIGVNRNFLLSVSVTKDFSIPDTKVGFFANRIESKCQNLHKMHFPFPA